MKIRNLILLGVLMLASCTPNYADRTTTVSVTARTIEPGEYDSLQWLSDDTFAVLFVPEKTAGHKQWQQVRIYNLADLSYKVLPEPEIVHSQFSDHIDSCNTYNWFQSLGSDQAGITASCQVPTAVFNLPNYPGGSTMYTKLYEYESFVRPPREVCDFPKPPQMQGVRLDGYEWLDTSTHTMLVTMVETYAIRYHIAIFRDCREVKPLLTDFYTAGATALAPSKNEFAFVGRKTVANPNDARAQLLEPESIYVHHMDTGITQEFFSSDKGLIAPIGWTKDSMYLYAKGTIGNVPGIWKIEVATGKLELLWRGRSQMEQVSPNGKFMIVFEKDPNREKQYINDTIKLLELE